MEQLLKTANSQDQSFLVQFHEMPELTVPFTSDVEQMRSQLSPSTSPERSALWDGVYLAVNEMKKSGGPRRAIVIITDDAGGASRYTESEVIEALRTADIQIYAVRIGDSSNLDAMLDRLTAVVGGRYFVTSNLADSPDVASKIGLELRSEYALGYVTKSFHEGEHRQLEVSVAGRGLPPLTVRTRSGYFTPTQ